MLTDSLSLWIFYLLKLSMGKVMMVNVRNKFELKFSDFILYTICQVNSINPSYCIN